MLEGLFRLLFKYRPLVFEQGDFTVAASRPMLVALAVTAAVAAYALATYRGAPAARPRDRAALAALRLALLGVLAFCLMRPTLVVKAAVPQQNFLGVLVDDSRSMQIADGGEPRGDFVRQQLASPDAPLAGALSKKFVLRFFRFSSSADRVTSPAGLQYAGTSTRLGSALERARDELAGLPLAGLVVVSDGADTSNRTLDEPLASLKARAIPVFTVGVGRERFARDIQLTRVETPRLTLKGTSLVVNAVVTATGYAGRTVPLTVEDEGRIVGTEDVTLPPDGESTTVHVRFTASEAGARTFRFRIPPQDGEQVAGNNARDALIEVDDSREKILYYEGEPRFEAKFVLQAVDGDRNLQVVLLDRTAENKYFRRNVDNPDELVAAVSEDARGAVRVSRDRPRQRRGGVVHARAAPHARRLRQPPRRRPADARRPARVRGRRLGGHAARRRLPRRPRKRRAEGPALLRRAPGAADTRGRDVSRSPSSPARRPRRRRAGTICRRSRR